MDLKDVPDFVEDGVYLLDGEDGLGGRGCGFERTHRLVGQNETETVKSPLAQR